MVAKRVDVFRGIRPRVAPRLLSLGEAQTASNVRLGAGSLDPWFGPELDTADLSLDVAVIHRMRNGGVPFWLFFTDEDVSVAKGPVENDALERTYWTGEAQPRMTYLGIAEGPTPPDDYRYLGIPAPTAAPTTTGEALPADTITGTSDEGSFDTNYLHADVSYSLNWSNTSGVDWYMVSSIGGYEAPGTVRSFDMDFAIGQEMRVASVVDADTVTLEDAHGANYIARSVIQDRTHPTNNFRDADTGTTRAAYFRFYVPNGIEVTLPTHNLQEGDIIRVTSIPSTIRLMLTQAATGSFDGVFFGATTSGQPGYGSSTWPAPVTMADDGFYVAGGQSFPFVEVWSDIDGAVGTDEFDLQGSFTWEIAERDGQPYEDVVNNVEARTYVYTFVSALGEEGPPSPPSDAITVVVDSDVDVDTFENPPTTKREITTYRIYRAVTGTQDTDFFFVGEHTVVPGGPQTTFTDDVPAIELGELIQTTTWDPPDENMQGLIALPNGMMAGFIGQTLCLSEPYFPHAWPPEYRKHVDFDIVGLGVIPNGVAVLTTGPAYIGSGDHPRAMSLSHFTASQSCVSRQSIASTINSVIYGSPDGLAEIGSAGFRLITDGYVQKREWQSQFDYLHLHGAWHDGKYVGIHGHATHGVGLVFDPNDESIGLSTITNIENEQDEEDELVSLFLDAEEDKLYILRELDTTRAIYAWDVDEETPVEMVWKSGRLVLEYPANMTVARIVADTYPVTFSLWNDQGTQVVTDRVVNSSEIFRLPGGYLTDWIEMEVGATGRVHTVHVAETVEELELG